MPERIKIKIKMEARKPCVSFIIKYLIFDTSEGMKEKACRCTDRPENPSANAEIISFSSNESVGDFTASFIALVTSHRTENDNRIPSFFTMPEISPSTPEKKTIQDATLSELSPADLIESIRLKLCLELSYASDIFSDALLKIIPVSIEERIIEKYSIKP